MIYNWQEIDIETFKEIFDRYWNQDPALKDKVLEIQNLPALYSYCSDIRVFFGSGIKLKEWKEYNEDILKVLDMGLKIPGAEDLKEFIFNNEKLSMCFLENKGPRITPLGLEGHYNLIWSTCFGETNSTSGIGKLITKPLTLFYYKENGKYICDLRDSGEERTDTRMIRLRGMDLEDWKNMITEYTKNGRLLYTENDVPRDNIDVLIDQDSPFKTLYTKN